MRTVENPENREDEEESEDEEEVEEFTAEEAADICITICEKLKEYIEETYDIKIKNKCNDPIETVDPHECNSCKTLCNNMVDRMRDYKQMLKEVPKIVKVKS